MRPVICEYDGTRVPVTRFGEEQVCATCTIDIERHFEADPGCRAAMALLDKGVMVEEVIE